jgi:quercetin dioxygenase-like cupin family protein
MKIHDWSAIALETLNPTASRKAIHTGRMTIARLTLKAGAVVPTHHHENEQVAMLERGKLRWTFPDGERIQTAGQALEIPPNVPHSVEALEDSQVTDLFAPVREDWLRGDDAYLRGSPVR